MSTLRTNLVGKQLSVSLAVVFSTWLMLAADCHSTAGADRFLDQELNREREQWFGVMTELEAAIFLGNLPHNAAIMMHGQKTHCVLNDERFKWSCRGVVSFKNTFSMLSDDYIKCNSADAGGRDRE